MKTIFKLFLFFIGLLLISKSDVIQENFYGWIPTPTRYFRHIGSDLRGNPVFIGHDEKGIPIFYDKNRRNIGYGNKGYRGSFMMGLFPFLYDYLH